MGCNLSPKHLCLTVEFCFATWSQLLPAPRLSSLPFRCSPELGRLLQALLFFMWEALPPACLYLHLRVSTPPCGRSFLTAVASARCAPLLLLSSARCLARLPAWLDLSIPPSTRLASRRSRGAAYPFPWQPPGGRAVVRPLPTSPALPQGGRVVVRFLGSSTGFLLAFPLPHGPASRQPCGACSPSPVSFPPRRACGGVHCRLPGSRLLLASGLVLDSVLVPRPSYACGTAPTRSALCGNRQCAF